MQGNISFALLKFTQVARVCKVFHNISSDDKLWKPFYLKCIGDFPLEGKWPSYKQAVLRHIHMSVGTDPRVDWNKVLQPVPERKKLIVSVEFCRYS